MTSGAIKAWLPASVAETSITVARASDVTVLTDSEGKEVPLDGVPAFDRQDVEFVSAIRQGREPESSAASCVPTMALLDKIEKSMNRS